MKKVQQLGGDFIKKFKLTTSQIIITSFLLLVSVGTVLLMLPIAKAGPGHASFLDALFTATSASCVTGLIVQDTATYWSLFGQIVILCLLQVGGMGVVTMAIAVIRIAGKKAGLLERSVMQESVSAPAVGGIIKLTSFILKMSLIFEVSGAVLLMPSFISEFGVVRGIWYSFFHSISAFCNAGFDLMGYKEKFSSLTSYAADPVVNIVIILLIVIGGLGFLVWNDIKTYKFSFSRYRAQSKLVLVTSAILLAVPTVLYFFLEYKGLPFGERLLSSLFTSVTARTAGFNTTDLASLSEPGQALMICLMLVGGSPGSTAGGMKTTTLAVLVAASVAVFRRQECGNVFQRKIEPEVVRNALAIFTLYLTLFITTGCIISRVEGLPLQTCLFETASAVGTVGVTLGITPGLGNLSHILIIGLMFFGRVGGLTLIYASLTKKYDKTQHLPADRFTVG